MMRNPFKNNLDEMQDSRLLKIEETGLWLAFWGLTAAIVIQFVIGTALKEIAGEAAVLVVLSIYIAFTTVKNGLWTRRWSPTKRTNMLCSFVPAAILGGVHGVRRFLILREPFSFKPLLGILIVMAAVYALCFALLELLRVLYQKRRDQLEETGDEGEG